jgi:hypothetical protein
LSNYQAVNRTTEEIFRPLNDRLFEIKNSNAKAILDKRTWLIDQIRPHLFLIPGEEALFYLNLAIDTITQIESMGRELSNSYHAPYYKEQNEDFTGEPPQEYTKAEVYELHTMFILNLKEEVQGYLVELDKIKNEVTDKISGKLTAKRDKIKLNLTVDEIGILFSALEDNRLITVPNKKAFSRLIADTFSSKDKEEFNPDTLYNKLTTFQPIPLDNMEQYLGNMLKSIQKYRAKILS